MLLRLLGCLKMFEEVLRDFERIEPVPPTILVDHGLTLDDGGIDVRVLHLGRANTRGDLVVHLPERDIVITGDLLTHPIPTAVDAYMTEWLEALRRLAELEARSIVPGHGPVMRDGDYLERVTRLVDSVVTHVRRELAAGATREEIGRTLDLTGPASEITGDDARLQWGFDRFFVQPALDRSYAELSANDRVTSGPGD